LIEVSQKLIDELWRQIIAMLPSELVGLRECVTWYPLLFRRVRELYCISSIICVKLMMFKLLGRLEHSNELRIIFPELFTLDLECGEAHDASGSLLSEGVHLVLFKVLREDLNLFYFLGELLFEELRLGFVLVDIELKRLNTFIFESNLG
jgi:hypothetical protein